MANCRPLQLLIICPSLGQELGAGAEKIQPQLYLNIYNALSVGSRAAQFGTLGLLLPTIASAAPENRYFIQNANLQLWKTNIGLGWWMGVYIESEIYLR